MRTSNLIEPGMRALIESAAGREERLPVLEAVCDRMIRGLAASLRQLTADAFDIRMANMRSFRFEDAIAESAAPALFGVFKAVEWGGYGVVIADAPFIGMTVETLMGGAKGALHAQDDQDRPYTSIETSLVAKIFRLAIEGLAEGFRPVSTISMLLERLESNPRFAAVVRPDMSVAACDVTISLDGRTGKLTMVLPHATLEPVRDRLKQQLYGEAPGQASPWREEIEAGLRLAHLKVEALLAERSMTLREVERLEVGQFLRLDRGADEPVDVLLEGLPAGVACHGQRNGRIALRPAEAIRPS